ncbi:hypothetical protein B9Q04_03375 [Candidatus Marsarchaeota G2 archaeon BE_D]|uniref:Nickel/cobalt efflux system n=1 Tax=Candidatus Marsarchaeota G2 archaeon BE_D TaxID=1978158 RepID=A0A2R6CD94_9ARCH|nr:MAG: hypothetical protein B9Q04_03375 [Candidatus Marsarchaeota G2 archaeon BE_D]
MLPLLIIFIISLGLGLAHGAEPDHLATISALGKGLRKAVWFAAGHSLGFVLIALPILFVLHALPENDLFKLVADAVSIGIAGIVIYAELSGRELEVGYRSGGGLGIAQGALAFTPTKALLLVLASTASPPIMILSLALFTLASSASMVGFGLFKRTLKREWDRYLNLIIAIVAIIWTTLSIFAQRAKHFSRRHVRTTLRPYL